MVGPHAARCALAAPPRGLSGLRAAGRPDGFSCATAARFPRCALRACCPPRGLSGLRAAGRPDGFSCATAARFPRCALRACCPRGGCPAFGRPGGRTAFLARRPRVSHAARCALAAPPRGLSGLRAAGRLDGFSCATAARFPRCAHLPDGLLRQKTLIWIGFSQAGASPIVGKFRSRLDKRGFHTKPLVASAGTPACPAQLSRK